MKSVRTGVLLLLALVSPGRADDDLRSRAAAAESGGYLKQAFALYLEAWQGLGGSDDVALRETLVRLGAQLDPPPEIPEEARRRAARGQMAFAAASGKDGFAESARELRAALHAAPWWPEATFNLALVEESLGEYENALSDLKVYLASDPADAPQVRARLYQIEYRKERAPATLYVLWPHRMLLGKGDKFTVRLDGRDVATIFNGSYLRTRVTPGSHTFQISMRFMGITSHSKIQTFEVAANRVYAIAIQGGRGPLVEEGMPDLANLEEVPVPADLEAPAAVLPPPPPAPAPAAGSQPRETAQPEPSAAVSNASPNQCFLVTSWGTKAWTPRAGETFEVHVTSDAVRRLFADSALAAQVTRAMEARLTDLGFVRAVPSRATLAFELAASSTEPGRLYFTARLTRSGHDFIHDAWLGSVGVLNCPSDPTVLKVFVEELMRCFPDLGCYPPPSAQYPNLRHRGRYVSLP